MLTRYILSILVLPLILSATAQEIMKVSRKGVPPADVTKKSAASSYSIDQLTGKWQELSRKDKGGSPVSFKDTLYYDFLGNGQVMSRDRVNLSMKGEAAIEPVNVLVAAADVFTINSLNYNRVVLDDGEYVHTLVRKKEFWYETLPTNEIVAEKFSSPVSISSSAIIGKWKVYRRDAEPGEKTGKVLINILNVTGITGEKSAKGEITFYREERLETLPCTITINGERMHISTEKYSWNLNVYKADGKDFVFGDPSLMYYCKQL